MKNRKAIVAAVAVAAFVAVCFFFAGGGDEGKSAGELYATVQEGPLVISVEEYGEIAPSQQIVLKNEVQGRCSIISLIPEGSIVEEGDVLVQLDVSAKIDERDSQEITLQNAESSLEVAREALEIQKNQSASDVELAEEAFVFAKEDLEKYEKGEYPAKLINQITAGCGMDVITRYGLLLVLMAMGSLTCGVLASVLMVFRDIAPVGLSAWAAPFKTWDAWVPLLALLPPVLSWMRAIRR